ncbi:MAG: cell division protein ZapE [Pseudomonadota bacterium]|nr:cell division protein ZapE [Pseudomonadota bacterium]
MDDGPLKRYRAMIDAGELRADPAQSLAAEKLQVLANRLATFRAAAKGDFFSFFSRKRAPAPQGLYMFGGVGRGKTMLMDLFFDSVAFAPKRRTHFHEFMGEVHELIGRFRRMHKGDPIPLVAEAIASEASLICFDEMHVTDIADAMILGRLFEALFGGGGVVVVATSNSAPDDLYKDGLNRSLLQPFVVKIKNRMENQQLEAATDYRMEKLRGTELYFSPANTAARKKMRAAWKRLTGRERGTPQSIEMKGRKIGVPEAALGVARFDFEDLCGAPLGANDYLAIARQYHTLLVEGIPVFAQKHRNQARRFINLIDVLYDNGVRLVASAAAEPEKLYRIPGPSMFERTASRLIEMRSDAYLAGNVSD